MLFAGDKKNNIACGVCGAAAIFYMEDYRDFSLWQCEQCKIQFWTPFKNPGANWYEHDVRYSFRNKKPLATPEVNHLEFFKDAKRFNISGKILDIGMGTGNFLFAAAKRGFNCFGIDFDNDAINMAKEFFGLENVYVGDLEFAKDKFKDDKFDAVTLFEVLEHLDNPADFIGGVRTVLKDGGFLAISVPYRNMARFLNRQDLPPRHLTRWDKISMRNFLEKNGFSVVSIRTIPVSFGFLITKFHFWFQGILSFRLLEKVAAHSAAKDGMSNGQPGSLEERDEKLLTFLQMMARIKDYLLFSIPAAFLYLWLMVTKRRGLGLYAVAVSE